MGKAFGILMLVAGLWAAAEITTKGVEGAFGGMFASADAPAQAGTSPASIPKRSGAAVDDAHHEAAERRARMLGAN